MAEKNAKTHAHTQTHTHFRIYISRDIINFRLFAVKSNVNKHTHLHKSRSSYLAVLTPDDDTYHRFSGVFYYVLYYDVIFSNLQGSLKGKKRNPPITLKIVVVFSKYKKAF